MNEDRGFDYINVIPLVDIMLVLLTIVLITATFIVQGDIPVKLPQAKHSKEISAHIYQMSLTKEGFILWDGKMITMEELEKVLSALPTDSSFAIFSDREASVQSLVGVLDLLKAKGFSKVSIKTEKIN